MNKRNTIIAACIAALNSSFAYAVDCPTFSFTEGEVAGGTLKAAVKYKNFRNGSSGAADCSTQGGCRVWLGQDPLSTATNRVTLNGFGWQRVAGVNLKPNAVEFKTDTGPTLKSTVTPYDGSAQPLTYPSSGTYNPGPVNYVKIQLNNGIAPGSDRGFQLKDITVNGCPVSTNGVTATNGQNKTYNIQGADLSSGFTIGGNIVINGEDADTNDTTPKRYVEISVGYLPPPDNEGPVTSKVEVAPNPVIVNGNATVTADVDDTDRGGSNIQSAEYQLNGGSWRLMAAADGSFDSVMEAVTATFSVNESLLGENTVCVRGTDVIPNTGDEVCTNFNVIYNFEGFFSPINRDIINSAKSGQAIPVKWRLTDATPAPIADPFSFINLHSYQIDCTSGDAITGTDEIETYSGGSGLQYLGDGNWQFNWKTPKSYAGQCRKMYVELQGPTYTPEVRFDFKAK